MDNQLISKLTIGILLIVVIIIVHEIRRYDQFCVKDKIINKLVRQAARWSTAASQDKNAMIAVLHANYGTGYWGAVKEFATPKDIELATGINYFQFEDEIYKVQDNATRKMASVCPQFAPKPTALTAIAGEGI